MKGRVPACRWWYLSKVGNLPPRSGFGMLVRPGMVGMPHQAKEIGVQTLWRTGWLWIEGSRHPPA